MRIINTENIDEWLFDYFEGNLNKQEQAELTGFLNRHPELQADFDSWKNSYVVEPEMVYPHAENLLVKPKIFLPKSWIAGTIAVVVTTATLFIGYFGKDNSVKVSENNTQAVTDNVSTLAHTEKKEIAIYSESKSENKNIIVPNGENKNRKTQLENKTTEGTANDMSVDRKNENNNKIKNAVVKDSGSKKLSGEINTESKLHPENRINRNGENKNQETKHENRTTKVAVNNKSTDQEKVKKNKAIAKDSENKKSNVGITDALEASVKKNISEKQADSKKEKIENYMTADNRQQKANNENVIYSDARTDANIKAEDDEIPQTSDNKQQNVSSENNANTVDVLTENSKNTAIKNLATAGEGDKQEQKTNNENVANNPTFPDTSAKNRALNFTEKQSEKLNGENNTNTADGTNNTAAQAEKEKNIAAENIPADSAAAGEQNKTVTENDLAAANLLEQGSKTALKKNAIGLSVSPFDYCYGVPKPIDGSSTKATAEKFVLGKSVELKYRRDISKKYSAEAGIAYSKSGCRFENKFSWQTVQQTLDSTIVLPDTLNPDTTYSYFYHHYTNDHSFRQGVIHEFKFMELPVRIKYMFGKGNFVFNISTGISLTYLLEVDKMESIEESINDKSISPVFDSIFTGREYREIVSSKRTIGLTGMMGLGVDYYFNQRFYVNLQPEFKCYFSSYKIIMGTVPPNFANRKLYSAGMHVGVYYKF